MTQYWTAEREVSASLARSLIEDQFPELAPARVEPFGMGWDNTAYRVNEQFVFRFPHRFLAAGFMEAEIAVLPHLATRLPLPVPDPIFIGRSTDIYPWPFAGYRWLPGRTACTLALNDEERARLAEPLGHFLACLHALPVLPDYHLGTATDMFSRLAVEEQESQLRAQLERIDQLGLMPDVQPLVAVVEEADWTDDVPTEPLVLVHGDLFASHLLIDDSDDLCGVIDWGNVERGGIAVDLMVAHLFLPPAAHAAFRAAYGLVTEADWHMARVRALFHASAVVLDSRDLGNAVLLRECLTALRYIAVG